MLVAYGSQLSYKRKRGISAANWRARRSALQARARGYVPESGRCDQARWTALITGFTGRESSGPSRFSRSARRGAAVGRKGRPTGPPDGPASSPMPAACPGWTPPRLPDARTPLSDTPPCRELRPATTT